MCHWWEPGGRQRDVPGLRKDSDENATKKSYINKSAEWRKKKKKKKKKRKKRKKKKKEED